MYKRGRTEDTIFGSDELLYRRYLREHWIDGCFSPLGFKFSEHLGQSVNRQKYSEPEDVLFFENGTFNDDWGVLEFVVRDIPRKLPEEGSAAFVFFPKHTPEDLNYAHSEVWCCKDVGTGVYAEPSKTVKKLLRTELSRHVFVRIQARR